MINNISVMLVAANWLLDFRWKRKWELLKKDWVAIFFILYYAIYAASLLYSDNVHAGAFVLEKKLSLLALPMILATSPPLKLHQVKQVMTLFIVSCFLVTVYCFCWAVYMNYTEGYTLSYLYNAVVNDVQSPGRYEYFNFWFFTYRVLASPVEMHPIYLSMYVIFASSAAVWMWWKKTKFALSALFVVYLLLNFFFVVLLSSRTQLFCALLIVSIYWLYYSYKKSQLIKGLVLIFLLFGAGLVFVLINPVIRERILVSSLPGSDFHKNLYGEGGMSLRLYKWKYSFETFMERPLIGAGAGAGQEKLVEVYRRNNFMIGVQDNFNPHNQILQSAIDTGIIGVTVLLGLFAASFRKAIRSRSRIYLLLIALFFVSCLTESMLEVNKGVAFFSFFSAILGCSCLRNNEAPKPTTT